MSIITRMRKQKAVLWQVQAGQDAFGQSTLFDSPVEIDCRWEYVNKEIQANKGGGDVQAETLLSKGTVYVDREVFVGSYLRLATLASLTGDTSDPRAQEARRVLASAALPNLRNSETLRTAYVE